MPTLEVKNVLVRPLVRPAKIVAAANIALKIVVLAGFVLQAQAPLPQHTQQQPPRNINHQLKRNLQRRGSK